MTTQETTSTSASRITHVTTSCKHFVVASQMTTCGTSGTVSMKGSMIASVLASGAPSMTTSSMVVEQSINDDEETNDA